MQFIKLGKRYINMALVTEIQYAPAVEHYNDEEYRIFFGFYDDGSGTQAYAIVDDADMIALEMWLADNSTDIRAPMISEG